MDATRLQRRPPGRIRLCPLAMFCWHARMPAPSIAQIATAVWVIDKLALRVGGEKGADEADTVGCCSLRTEHLTFHEDASVHEVELEFLGKDSMRFKETIDFDKHGDIGKRVFKNLQQFCKGKRQLEEVFDYLDPR